LPAKMRKKVKPAPTKKKRKKNIRRRAKTGRTYRGKCYPTNPEVNLGVPKKEGKGQLPREV